MTVVCDCDVKFVIGYFEIVKVTYKKVRKR